MEVLGPLDAEFVEAEDEDRHVSMGIGSIAIFEGPAPSYEEFVAAIEERLPLVPRYRQKVRTIPLRLGRPVWVDDPNFDIRSHIIEAALPAPGEDGELAALMARVMAQRLDRDRPLWEDWLVTGLADGHWALISKVHHCMVDGVSGTDLYRVMFDASPQRSPLPESDSHPTKQSTFAMNAKATADALLVPGRALQAAARRVVRPAQSLRQVRDTGRATLKLARGAWPADASSLSGPIGQQRRYTSVRVSLDDVKTIKRSLGGTVNDTVLAAITAGFRSLLLSRGETPKARMVPSLVPVSMRAPGEENLYDNRVSAMIVHLPVHQADPVDQLAAIRKTLTDLKGAGESAAGQAFVTLSSYIPYPLASLTRFAFRVPQRGIVTVTTNVPGPRQPLYCLGRELVEIRPYVPIASTIRIGVAIFSYRDQITFGITGDYQSAPDIAVLAQGIEEGVAQLLKAVDAVEIVTRELSSPRKRP